MRRIDRIKSGEFAKSQIRSLETHIKTHSTLVRITHPAHPLRGRSFPVVQRQRRGQNTELVKIQLEDGERRLIPLDWTDQAPPVVTLPGARFLIANLISLRQRLDLLLQASEKSDIIPPRNDTQIEGGTDEDSESIHVVETDRGSTSTSSRHSGTDAFAPTGEARGG